MDTAASTKDVSTASQSAEGTDSNKCPVDEQSKKRAVDDSNDSDDQSGPEKKRGATHETILASKKRAVDDSNDSDDQSGPEKKRAATQETILALSEVSNKQENTEKLSIKTAEPSAASSSAQGSDTSTPKVQSAGSKLYERLCKYTHSPNELSRFAYPRPVLNEPGKVTIKVPEADVHKVSPTPLQRVCCRCKQRFFVTSEGDYATTEQCVYHWGRCLTRRGFGGFRNSSKYHTCCGRSEFSRGCHTYKSHVHLHNKFKDLTGYVQTRAGTRPPDGNYGIYAVDCEMIYTTVGSEVARVTVVDHELKPVYEQLVKPAKPVIDYNTRFSGLTESALKDVTTTLKDVQNHLLGLFSEDTILVGHSLEHDLMVLKIIHSKIVDTSILFPHHLGPPYKQSLKRLCSEILGKVIQENSPIFAPSHHLGPPYKQSLKRLCSEILGKVIQENYSGHSSQEDAVATMELVLYKMRQDQRWRL